MATNKIEIQNSNGDIYYPHSSADIIKYGTNSTVAKELDKLPQTYLSASKHQTGGNGYIKLSNGHIDAWATNVVNAGGVETAELNINLPSGLFTVVNSVVLSVEGPSNVYVSIGNVYTSHIRAVLRATVYGGGIGVGICRVNARVRGV